jgi:hypothetical protein
MLSICYQSIIMTNQNESTDSTKARTTNKATLTPTLIPNPLHSNPNHFYILYLHLINPIQQSINKLSPSTNRAFLSPVTGVVQLLFY